MPRSWKMRMERRLQELAVTETAAGSNEGQREEIEIRRRSPAKALPYVLTMLTVLTQTA